MSSFNFSLYDPSMIESGQQTTQPVSKSEAKQESTFDFGMYDENHPTGIKEPESWGKWIARTLYQIPAGMAQVATWPMDIIAIMGAADATDPSEIEHIRRISEREGIPFDEEKYMAAVQQAQDIFPTQRNIEEGIESKTGLPLTPQDRFQKGLRYLSTVATALPNQPFGIRGTNINVSKPLATGAVSATKETAQTLGVPEPIAELTSPFVLKAPMTNQPVATGIGKKTKPSGMKELIFEQSPAREISESRFQKINQALESDFRGLLNVIEQEGPISETRLNLQTNPGYKAKILDTFDDVRQLAISLPEKHNTDIIRGQLASKLKTKTKTRMTPTEYENSYDYHMNKLIKETPKKEVFAEDLVEQYRKNNRSLSEIYEKDKSSGFNRGKKDALLDYNRTLAEYIEKQYPNSAFSNLFKETNRQWTQIKDAEFIDAYLDKLFEGKINYKQAEKAFDKNLEEPFKRALGKEGFENFKTLMKDLYSTKEAMGRLKIAKDLGFTDLAKMGGLFFTAPSAAKLKFTADTLKNMYKTLLDKPRLGITWKEANDAFKKGDFAQAQAKMTILTDELEKTQAASKPTNTININNPIGRPNQPTSTQSQGKIPTLQQIKQLEQKAKSGQTARNDLMLEQQPPKKPARTKDLNLAKEEKPSVIELPQKKPKLIEYKTPVTPKKSKTTRESAKSSSKKADTLPKIDKKIENVERQDISVKGLKQQKDYFINALENAIKNPSTAEKINIKIPGDGEFTLNNKQDVLEKVLKKVEKNWPTTKSINAPYKKHKQIARNPNILEETEIKRASPTKILSESFKNYPYVKIPDNELLNTLSNSYSYETSRAIKALNSIKGKRLGDFDWKHVEMVKKELIKFLETPDGSTGISEEYKKAAYLEFMRRKRILEKTTKTLENAIKKLEPLPSR